MGCCGGNNKEDAVEMYNNNDAFSTSSGKHGEKRKYDPNFNGPIKNRSCTDVICCIIFVVYIAFMIVIGILAYLWGDPYKLLYPSDTHGNTCGEGTLANKKYLFYFDLLECIPDSISQVTSMSYCKTHQICVEKCPSANTYYLDPTFEKANLYCKYDANVDATIVSDLVTSGQCAKYTIQSEALLYRCVPTVIGDKVSEFFTSHGGVSTDGKNLTSDNMKWGTIAQAAIANVQNAGKKVVADLQTAWYWILAGFGITMVVAFIYILMMRWVAGLMVWLTTYLVLTIIGYATYYCYTEYKRLADGSGLDFTFTTELSTYKDRKETWLVLGCICALVLLVLILLLLALRKRISLAIQLIKEGSRAITSMLSTLFFPIIPWIMQLVLFAWFCAVLAFLATSGEKQFKQVNNGTLSNLLCSATDAVNDFIDSNKTISCNFEKYKTDDNVLRLQIAHLFGWLWFMNFIIAFGQCVLAGAFASWYWAWDKKTDVPSLPIIFAMGRTLRYHTGSLAFGSLIIAIVQMIRAALEYIEYKLKGSGTEPSPVAKFILKCLKCCFWCLEKFIKFLNRNAYIEIAVYGKNFCTSAKNAFFLLLRNILRVAVLDKVTDFLLFIGKLTITGAMGVASFYFFNNRTDLNYYLTPIIIIVIGAWVVCTAFFGVFEMAIDTIFLSFLEDCERHDGTPEKPYYMSKKLSKILGKKNKKVEEDD